MLKLRRVLILGFKSFCDSTDLTVPGCGIAVVAGPNGCGKSNILDSMSWVLGEQRARNLRSVQMQDVIFAGTSERKALGMAEVTLTLVDPEVYEDPGPSEPDFTVDLGKGSDWDEDEIRRQYATETEEIVAAAQPGRVSEEVESNLSQSVAVKIRRRRLQCVPDKGEIVITRRLFRTGESEYLLNGKICRLRDIQDIFTSTGLGSDTYAIIGQEQIGQLLSSKPNDRRAVIEEAAGVSGLKTQKRLAELRLEGAKQNLGRVDDIFEEVSRQMGSLKRQAAKAERFASIHEELRGQSRVVLASHLMLIDSGLSRLQAEIVALTERSDDASVTIEAMESRQHSLTEVGYKLDRESQEVQNHATAIEIDLERVLSREHHVRERMKELGEWLNTSASDLEQVRRELIGIVREREQQGAIRDAVAGEVCSCRQRVQVRQQEMSAATDQIFSAERQMEAGRQHAMQLLALAGNARSGAIQAEESLAMLEREAERLTSELGQGREDLANLCRDKDQAKQQFESTNTSLTRITHDIETLGRTLQAHRTQESVLITQRDALRAEQAVAAGRRLSLDALIRSHSYASESIQQLLRPGALGEGVTAAGTLADYLEVRGEYESVVEEFLRSELNYVVVESWGTAEEGVRMLKSDVGGRATFLVHSPQVEANSAVENGGPINEPGLAPLKEEIQVLNGFGPSLEGILPKLKRGYIVRSYADAQRLATEFTDSFFITPQGECFHNLTVTAGKTTSEGPFTLKRERQSIETKLNLLEKELLDADSKRTALTTAIEGLTSQIETRSDERRRTEVELANYGAALKQMEHQVSRMELRLEERTLQASRNTVALTAKRTLIGERREEAMQLEVEQQAAEQALDAQRIELAGLRQNRENLQQEAAEVTAELAMLEERQRGAESALQDIDSLGTDLERRVLATENQRNTAETERELHTREIAELTERRQVLTEQRTDALSKVESGRASAVSLRQELSKLETDLRAERVSLEGLRESRAAASTEAARLRADLEHCETSALTELGIEAQLLRVEAEVVRLTGNELAAAEEACRMLHQRMEQMGPVNMTALDEFKETAMRHEFLETQRKDLFESIESAQGTIKEIEQVARAKFEEALVLINENFEKVFGYLFSGGHALLRLTDQENQGESGLEIIASPPGKKLQNVLLLSGGEKALTALALLVAIFQYRPSPFCVLDEVDAPLDETNVGRFADLMHSLSHDTQFLVVTHSKRMMQSADRIFGVTMQEPGVSKVFSLHLDHRDYKSASV